MHTRFEDIEFTNKNKHFKVCDYQQHQQHQQHLLPIVEIGNDINFIHRDLNDDYDDDEDEEEEAMEEVDIDKNENHACHYSFHDHSHCIYCCSAFL